MSFTSLIRVPATLILATVVALRAERRPRRSSRGRPHIRRGERERSQARQLAAVTVAVAGREPARDVGDAGATPTPTVSVVIPALNEEGSLAWVLENLPEWVDEVVLVDGLSTDRTEALMRTMRPDAVVVHQRQRGKGAALRAGFAAASGDIIVMIDADGSTDPREMGEFVEALEDGADFVKGSRHIDDGGSADFTRLRAAGNRSLVLMANLLYGSRFTDLCYGYCAFWRRHLDVLGLSADGFEIETQLVLGAVKAGLEIREVPSYELERRAGSSNLNAARDGIRILRTMLGRDPDGASFTLRKVHLPVWSTDRLPAEGERRRIDRRRVGRDESGYTGAERRAAERRETVGTVVALRAVYDMQPAPRRAAPLRARTHMRARGHVGGRR